jgi:hypothetical protein
MSHNDSIVQAGNLQEIAMGKQPPPFPLRMPLEIRQWLDKAAKENGRSLNNEIVHRLKELAIKEQVILK